MTDLLHTLFAQGIADKRGVFDLVGGEVPGLAAASARAAAEDGGGRGRVLARAAHQIEREL